MNSKQFASRLTIGIPKQEKLKTPITEFLQSRGFVMASDVYTKGETGLIRDLSGNIPNIRVEFIRAADGLLLLQEKVIGMAIIGSDVMRENTEGVNPNFSAPVAKMDLGIAGCKFQLAVPEQSAQIFIKPTDLNGLTIATSYPNILGAWLKENNVEPLRILVREGGVESCVRMGIADVVADLVDTGGTLKRHKLKPVFDICSTSAVCYARKVCDTQTELLVNEFIRQLNVNQAPKQIIRTPELIAA